MADDASDLDQLDDRFSGADAPDDEEQQEQTTDQSDDGADGAAANADANGGEPAGEALNWEPLTVYLLDERHQEFNKPFFMEMQLEYPKLQDYMKRELQQAAIEISMEYKEEVVERAKELHSEIEEAGGRDDDWEPLTVYLTDEQHREFNKPFFMRLQLEHAELQDYMKRELQQAAIEVAMEHKEEVAERAHEVHGRGGGE